MKQIKVLAFDIGGTVLDWHAGLTAAMAAWGTAHGIERDWHALANEHRRRSLRRMAVVLSDLSRRRSLDHRRAVGRGRAGRLAPPLPPSARHELPGAEG